MDEWQIPWCIGGDFNVVRFLMERLGANRMTQQMWQFNNFIEDHDLVDLPLRVTSFSWTNNQDRRVCSLLDGFLFMPDWME